MEKEFYYLDGKDQKGPFTLEQLKLIGLKPDTLVWADDFKDWKPAKEVEELQTALKKIPPPPPLIDSTSSANTSIKTNQIDNSVIVADSNIKAWVSFKIISFSIILIGLAVFSSFMLSNNKKSKYKAEIDGRIENIFEGKSVVLDGTFSLTEGVIEQTGYNASTKSDNFFQKWWEREKLYTIYKASNGGFTIYQLTKRYPDGFDLETFTSGDMGYKKPLSTYVPAEYWNGYKFRDSYYSTNYRLPVRQCYTETYDYFTKEDRKSPGSYSPGKFVDIANFPDLRNEYFYMDNTEPKQFTSSGQFSSHWYSSDEHGANINTEDWAVYYSVSGRHYVTTENQEAIIKDLALYLSMSVGSIILILIILGFSKPKYFRNLKIFGKRWKNLSYGEQVFFFEHSFFGKHSFTEIINDKVSKGIIKFIDRGNTLNLSYPNMEHFYKIDSIDNDNLKLISIKDKSEISFLRIGAEIINKSNGE